MIGTIEFGIVFGTFEIGQHVGIGPAGVAEAGPSVVVRPVAADIDHGVDRRGAAETLAARLIADAAVEARLRHRVERPVVGLAGDHQDHRAGRGHHPVVIRAAGLQQCHRRCGIFRQTACDRAAPGTAAYDDKIEALHALVPTFRSSCSLAAPTSANFGKLWALAPRFCFWAGGWAFMEILARAAFSAAFGPASARFGEFRRHKILKSGPAALSKAGARWYIPAATSRPLGPRVAFSGSLWTEAAPSGVAQPFQLFWPRRARFIAGWSSPVARQAHNLKVIGSNPIPATKLKPANSTS